MILAPAKILPSKRLALQITYLVGLATLSVLLYIEPHLRFENPSFTLSNALLSDILRAWLAISILLYTYYYRFFLSRTPFFLALICLVVLYTRVFFTPSPVNEVLILTPITIFVICSAFSVHVSISRSRYTYALGSLLVLSCLSFTYSIINASTFHFAAGTPLEAQRFTFTFESAGAPITIIVSMSLLIAGKRLSLSFLSLFSVALAFIRLFTAASKGSIAISLVIVFSLLLIKLSMRSIFILVLLLTLVMSTFYLFNDTDSFYHYLQVIEARSLSHDTFFARFDEAFNDWHAFLARPLLGWGRFVPGANFFGEPSYGHFALTGTIARFGLPCGLMLLYFVVRVFILQIRRSFAFWTSDIRAPISAGLFIYVIYLLIMGNPLFLYPAFGFLPLLVPATLEEE
ncbi:membrane hypothetical protein [Candidatus Defluviicoccus seviourii]|uniref:Uncharacterized protein n=1 Tax=Candidatus Defluviicoccus seviourii TaxID=2565273 RepID=A0A564WDW2_9PROT|nr:membrane hypothetical protein [Candidatus Defluviicoccus seviourii]